MCYDDSLLALFSLRVVSYAVTCPVMMKDGAGTHTHSQAESQAEHRDALSISSVMAVFKQAILQPLDVDVSTSKCGATCTANHLQYTGTQHMSSRS